MDYQERLFDLIRKEDVIIWAGAGMSMYAGYPSGQRLAEILLESLTEEEKNLISKNSQLSYIAEEFLRIKDGDRTPLINILKDVFSKRPSSNELHKKLSMIPHFQTIITTNYDSLFESTYTNYQLIHSAKQLSELDNKKTHIFKVHGVIEEPESLLITNSDYNKFFKDSAETNTYWAVIRERLATKSVLFIGYNIEDPNISVVFDRITDALGSRKDCFIVAPNLTLHKINDLERKQIHYINSNAEKIISDLLVCLKDCIKKDFEDKKVSPETLRQFLVNFDLQPDLKGDKDQYNLAALRPINNDVRATLNLSLQDDPKLLEDFKDFAAGKSFETLKIPENKLLDAKVRYNGVKILDSADKEFVLELKRHPHIETRADLHFESGFECNGIATKVYVSPVKTQIDFEFENADVSLSFEETNSNELHFQYKHKEICRNIKSEIDFFTFLKKLITGEHLTLFLENPEMTTGFTFDQNTSLLNNVSFYLNYFEKLKEIEEHFHVRFSNFASNTINTESIRLVTSIIANIKKEDYAGDANAIITVTFEDAIPETTLALLKKLNNNPAPISLCGTRITELHKQKINIGAIKIDVLNACIINLKPVLKGKTKEIKVRSRSGDVFISFPESIAPNTNLFIIK